MKSILSGTTYFLAGILGVLLSVNSINAQVTQCFTRVGTKPLVNLTLKPDVTIYDGVQQGKGSLVGYIEYLPPDYNPDRAYGLIIFFHGLSGIGDGTGTAENDGLCKIITDSWPTIIGLLDGMVNGAPQLPAYIRENYIILAPQYQQYSFNPEGNNNNYPGADAVEAMINYALNTYNNVDQNALVLTGLSSGANMIAEYISSSPERANKIAVANIISNCTQIGVDPIVGQAAQNIASANISTWFVGCIPDQTCDYSVSTLDWVNQINALNPMNEAVITTLDNGQCLLSSFHNAWTTFYHPNFNQNGMSLYSYIETNASVNAALPVNLKSFSARLTNNKVLLEWKTASESNNNYFIIERAGENMEFAEIGRIKGKVNSSVETVYSFEDSRPLSGINLYRLVQVDLDGKIKVYETRKVVNTVMGKTMAVSPNPFDNRLSVYLNLPAAKNLSVFITDINGRRLISHQQFFREGAQEVLLNTTSLPRGMYFLRIEGDGISESQKIIRR